MMAQSSHFLENLCLLREKAPEIAWQVQGCTPQPVERREIEVEFGDAQVLFFHGLGAGEAFAYAQEWLGEKNHLLLVEESPQAIANWLALPQAAEALRHPRVTVGLVGEPLFHFAYAHYSSLRAAFGGLPDLRSEPLKLRLLQENTSAYRLVDEFMQHCTVYFENFYRNIRSLPEGFHGNALLGQFEGVPAIICGAGPSLNKNIELLRTLQDRALIFAGGSALNAVSNRGVLPHFGAGVDPHYPQFQRLMTNSAFELPMFYRGRWYHEALSLSQGPQLYLNGAGGHAVASWFEKQLGIEGEALDEGHNVVNFTIDIARALGCNPIITVGLDLAYSDACQYADGVLSDRQVDPEALASEGYYSEIPLQHKDIYGQPVTTHWKWIAESRWISEMAAFHKETTFLNGTEGGIGFEGVPSLSLEEIASTHLTKRFALRERVHAALAPHSLSGVDRSQIQGLLNRMQESLVRSEALLGQLETATGGKRALFEVELEEEPAFEAVLSGMDHIFRSQMEREGLEDRDRFAFLLEGASKNRKILEEVLGD